MRRRLEICVPFAEIVKNNKMKKRNVFIRTVTALTLAAVMLLSVSCAGGSERDTGDLDIVCTIFPQYDLARSIAGDVPNVNLKLLLGAGQDSHDYDPSSADIAAVHSCDIFIYVGGESDVWVENMLRSAELPESSIISLMDIAEPITAKTPEGAEADEHDHEHEHGALEHVEYDEHIWTSPVNAMKISEAIADAMCEQMSENTDTFRANADKLRGELTELDSDIRALASSVDSPSIVVADRFPLLYFCNEYGISYSAAFSGCAASTEPSSKTVQYLINKVSSENIPVIFKLDMSTGNVAQTIADATGARVMTLWSCHTVSADDFAAGITYTELMRRNLAALTEAFAFPDN